MTMLDGGNRKGRDRTGHWRVLSFPPTVPMFISPASAKLQIVVSNPSFKIRRDPMTCLLYTTIPVDSHTLQIKDNDRDTLHRYATKLIL